MSRRKQYKKQPQQTKAFINPNVSARIIEKSQYMTRQDIQNWRRALGMARNVESRNMAPIQLLYKDILLDALLMSQMKNRLLKALSTPFMFQDENGNTNDTITNDLQNKRWVNDLCKAVLESIWFGHSLVEIIKEGENIRTSLIPRENVDTVQGKVYFDYTDQTTFIDYRKADEYGTTLLEFGDEGDLGILNNTVPHVLMKKFAQSCWSELCEIFGIPPRVMKTNTHDPTMLNRSEQMMRDVGSAAWFIIDSTEEFQWGQGVSTSGDVYQRLIQLCNSEISMVSSGAIIGQDTVNGSRSKDESAQNMLQQLINSDLSLLEEAWNSTIIPALQKLGILPQDIVLKFEVTEDISDLWQMTKDSLQYYDFDIEWMNRKFGLNIISKKANIFEQDQSLSLGFNKDDFF
ncbi:DUF935 family protein [Myroides odoratimimus]|uniref:phage portal protein family protein n=1 Tax=Myroides odoratimimus TaxID=76832 RepID=UPI0025791020|nr:DUF935 family protein [Myroides odoratimimus]MDM1033813.1 DUF935 family protein [Myroides odoratimimus]